MHELPSAIPEIPFLLALQPEELWAKMLFLMIQRFSPPGEPRYVQAFVFRR